MNCHFGIDIRFIIMNDAIQLNPVMISIMPCSFGFILEHLKYHLFTLQVTSRNVVISALFNQCPNN